MQLKKIVYFIIFLSQILFFSCSKCVDNEKMIGQYRIEIKGVTVKDTTKGREAINFLTLNSDYTFSLIDKYEKTGVSGSWKILSCQTVKNNLGERVPESILEFKLNNKKIKATFRDTRITFLYPVDLYDGRYKSLWYVKLSINK